MIASRAFGRAPRLRAMLAYILESAADGRTSGLRETSIALDVFKCDPSTFDPAHDPIVRVSARKLIQSSRAAPSAGADVVGG